MRVLGVGWVVTVFTYQGINHASNGIHISPSSFGLCMALCCPACLPRVCQHMCLARELVESEGVSGAGATSMQRAGRSQHELANVSERTVLPHSS